MVAGVSTVATMAAATDLAAANGSSIPSIASVELFIVLIVGGIVAWRSKRGDFYKAVAEEKTAESERLRIDNDKLRQATDITPILNTLDGVTKTLEGTTRALERHSEVTERVFEKVADMNGSLRAHGEAMKALADHLILDEAARGLLNAAAKRPEDDTTKGPR